MLFYFFERAKTRAAYMIMNCDALTKKVDASGGDGGLQNNKQCIC